MTWNNKSMYNFHRWLWFWMMWYDIYEQYLKYSVVSFQFSHSKCIKFSHSKCIKFRNAKITWLAVSGYQIYTEGCDTKYVTKLTTLPLALVIEGCGWYHVWLQAVTSLFVPASLAALNEYYKYQQSFLFPLL